MIETPQEMADLMRECIRITREFVDLANREFYLSIKYPKVKFSLKSGAAGRAWYQTNQIEYNPVLLRENAEDFLRTTTGHEVVHLAVWNKYREAVLRGEVKGHGREWCGMMRDLGLVPDICHSYDTSTVRGDKKRNIIPVREREAVSVAIGVGKIINFD